MTEDPEDVFVETAARHRRCFWLDGGGARAWSGRRSLVGWLDDTDPDAVSISYSAARREVTRHTATGAEVVGDDVFAVLEAEVAAGGQWFGYLGYAARPDLPARPSADLPDAIWMRPSGVRLFHHPAPASVVSGPGGFETLASASSSTPGAASARCSTPGASGARSSTPGASSAPLVEEVAQQPSRDLPQDYLAAFGQVQERLHAGDTYEVNLTRREQVSTDLDPVTAYLRLRRLNPAPYAGFLQHDVAGARGWLLSSSPERYALVDAAGWIETKPIKGTTPRSPDPAQDAAHARLLATHPKYRAENLMIVDLLRHDLAQVCEVGSVEVPSLMAVESYASVHQLVSTVRGRLRDDVGVVQALRALFPAGSMTGAPKLRTMQVIDQVEATPRGAYAGAFGWIGGRQADLGVVIRTLTTTGEGTWSLGTGGGITVASDPVEEYAETLAKAARLRGALGQP